MTGVGRWGRAFCGLLVVAGLGLTYLTFFPPAAGLDGIQPTVAFVLLAFIAFFCEYVDSSLGMGYGTLLTPLLILLGFSVQVVVTAVLLSEALTGLAAGIFHHRHGNVNWFRDTHARHALSLLTVCSLVGAAAAVFFALEVSKQTVNRYIALMLLAIALYLLWRARQASQSAANPSPTPNHPAGGRLRLLILGLVAAFNKGVSGGGYGPVLTGGQILAGVPVRAAVAVTSLAESGVCAFGLALYILAGKGPGWMPTLPLCLGAFLSVPLATWTVKMLPSAVLCRFIIVAMLYMGLLMLIKTLLTG